MRNNFLALACSNSPQQLRLITERLMVYWDSSELQRLLKFINVLVLTIGLASCGGGGGGSDNNGDTGIDITTREDNANIPAEQTGTEINNSRYYQGNRNGYKVSVLTTGLTGQVSLKLADEQVDISENTTTVFNSSFVVDTSVSVNVIIYKPALSRVE